jgi:single-strand DNA-binding protein
MMSKLVRVGRDAEVKYLPNGTAILNFPAVYDVGYGQNKKGQWINCAMFGDRATKVAEYITKGKQVVIYADDVCIRDWEKPDGSKGFNLECKLVSFDFVSDGQQQSAPQHQSAPKPQAAQQPAPQPQDEFLDDIPF